MIVQITVIDNKILHFRFENKDYMVFKCTPEIGEALKAIEDSLALKQKEWEDIA